MPIEVRDGLYWPAGDRECWRVNPGQVRDADHALKYVRNANACVQAGGNCGLWASYLAGKFREVWTIEADFTNYRCLVRNVKAANVRPIWAALSNKSGQSVDLCRFEANIGAHYVKGAGHIATITIDELELEHCDLIQLDIEGMEAIALEGARATIERFKPVIMIENNGSCELYYGTPADWHMHFPGYRVAGEIRRDKILVPCP